MKNLTLLFKTGILTIVLIFFGRMSMAATYTAVASGNWSSSATWGGTGPGDTITDADVIIIPSSIDVVLDSNVTINNVVATLTVTGSLTGDANLNLANGTLLGGGNVYLNSLIVGTGGFVTSAGAVFVNQLYTSQSLLTLTSTINVADSVIVNRGVIQLNSGSTINVANNVTIVISGGTFALNGGAINFSGVYSLLYTDSASSIGLEATYANLDNVTIDLPSSSDRIALSDNLSVGEALSLQSGILVVGSNSLDINGTIITSDSASISGSSNSNISFGGSGNAGNFNFAATGDTLRNLTLNISSSGSVQLGSGLFITGTLALNSGSIYIDSANLAITGAGNIEGGSDSSYVITNGTGSLVLTVDNSGDSAMFYVGTLAHFAPVMITNNSDSTGAFWVNAHPGVYLYGTSGTDISSTQMVVNTSWNIETALDSVTAGINANIRVFWNSAMQVNGFSDSMAFIAHYTGGAWERNTPTTATVYGNGNYSIALDNVTSFSPFAVFDSTTVTSTGVTEVKNDVTTLNIYPNPANDYVELGNIQDGGKYTLWLYNVAGQLILEKESANNMMDVSSLTAGYYTIAIDQSGNKYRSGLVIAR